MKEMTDEARVLRECLDGHSRSKMWLYAPTMIRAGMLNKEDIEVFSQDFQKEVSQAFDEKRADQIAAPNRHLRLGPAPWGVAPLTSRGWAAGALVKPFKHAP